MDDRPEGVSAGLRARQDRQTGLDEQSDDVRTDMIRADIQQTRAELSETIDAIQDRLRPRNLVAQAGETVRDATVGKVKDMATSAGEKASEVASQTRDAAENVIERVRENPIPAALIGFGTAWLLRSRGPQRPASQRRSQDADEEAGGFTAGMMERVRKHPVPAAVAGIGLAWLALADRGRATEALSRGLRRGYSGGEPGYTGSEGYPVGTTGAAGGERPAGSVQGGTPSAAAAVRGAASDLQEWSRDAAEGVRRTSRRAGNQLQRAMRANPLAVGAVAAGIGAAIGFALPETERENEWMGESRDAVVDRAQEMARDAADRVKGAADSVKNAADTAVDTIARGE